MSDPQRHQSRPLLHQPSSAIPPEEGIKSSRPPLDGETEPELPSALRGWQRLQKSTKRIVLGPQLSIQPVLPPQSEGTETAEGDGADATDAGAGAVVLDMEEDGGEERERLGVSASRHCVVQSIMDMSTAPTISEEAEQGLELLAHAVVADARAARAEAAEVRAAAADNDEDGGGRPGDLGGNGRQMLLGIESPRVSMGDPQGLEPSPRELPQSEPHSAASPEEDGLMGPNRVQGGAAPAPRLPSVKRSQLLSVTHAQHAHQGRKAVMMAKQQLVRTLTLSKHGETVEMELPVKELLRYIQNAVRAVHISHGQYQSQQSIGNGIGANQGRGEGQGHGHGHARSASVGMAGAGPSVAVSTRTAVPTPVGGLLNARDVRRLISGLDTESVKSKEMSILVRRHTIALNLDIIRCLVLWDRLIVVVPEGADSHCFDHLEENLRWLRVQQRAFNMDADEDDGALRCV